MIFLFDGIVQLIRMMEICERCHQRAAINAMGGAEQKKAHIAPVIIPESLFSKNILKYRCFTEVRRIAAPRGDLHHIQQAGKLWFLQRGCNIVAEIVSGFLEDHKPDILRLKIKP